MQDASNFANKRCSFLVLFATIISNAVFMSYFTDAAYAKMMPASGRPDIEIDVLMSLEAVEGEEGQAEPKWDYVTEDTFDNFGRDLDRLPMVFELAATPAVRDFFEGHKSELTGQYIDTLFIRYTPEFNEIFVSVWYSPSIYESMVAKTLPEEYSLQQVDEASFKVAILKQLPKPSEDYDSWVDFNILNYNLLPLASARVAYLSEKMQELYLQNKDSLLKQDTTLSLPDKEPIILQRMSAVMFAEMSRLDISYMDRPIGFYDGRITGYDTEAAQLVPLRLLPSMNFPLKPNEPILFIKSANQAISLVASLSTYDELLDASLEYPDGPNESLEPVRVYSMDPKNESYRTMEFVHYLPADKPPGIYSIQFNISNASKSTDIHAFASKGYLPPDFGTWSAETVLVDNTAHTIRYKISNEILVETISADPQSKSVMVPIRNSVANGKLMIELPRSLIDSTAGDGTDTSFLVSRLDHEGVGREAEAIEADEIISNDQVRVLSISLDEDTALVEIHGTHVAPEFEPWVFLIAGTMAGLMTILQRMKHSKNDNNLGIHL